MTNFRKVRSSSRRSAAIVTAGVAALFVCFQSTTSFSQPPTPTDWQLALGDAITGPAIALTGALTGRASAEGLPRLDGNVFYVDAGMGITRDEVLKAQDAWKSAVLSISKEYLANLTGEKFKDVAKEAAGELYGYDIGDVLFKPTKAKETPFRVTAEGALSYFIGYNAIKSAGFKEDNGFAINGGKGWKAVAFDNSQISLFGDLALAQGNYFFTDFDGEIAKVEYTFGYKKTGGKTAPERKLKIVLHHSSIPYSR